MKRFADVVCGVLAAGVAQAGDAGAALQPDAHASCVGSVTSVVARGAPGLNADQLHSYQDVFGKQFTGAFTKSRSHDHGTVGSCSQ